MVSGEWSEDIDALERVMEVYNEVGGDQEEQLSDLVTPYRRLVRVDDVHFRVMPFSANKQEPCRLYVFKDVVLIAVKVRKRNKSLELRKDSSFSNGFSGWLGSLSRKGVRASMRAPPPAPRTSVAASSQTSESTRTSYRLVSRLDLNKATVKRVPGKNAFQINHVYRQRVGGKLVTKIDMVEVWTESADQTDEIFRGVSEEIVTLKNERDEVVSVAGGGGGGGGGGGRSSVSGSSAGGGGPAAAGDEVGTGQRKWARGKSTIKRNNSRAWSMRTDPVREDGRSDSVTSEEASLASVSGGGGAESVSGLSLSDLESRYQVDFDQDSNEAEFAVTFGDGPMGFSLSSGSGLGVIVGKVADDSMASVGGVEVGDRLVAIRDEEIGLDMSWRECVEVIKSCERPVEVRFMRNFKVNAQVEKSAEAKAQAGGAKGQRAWAKKKMQRTRSFGSTIISLGELEKMYQSTAKQTGADEEGEEGEGAKQGGREVDRMVAMFERLESSQSESERACGSVLREIFETERAYVNDLRSLIGDYMIPLRRTVRRVRCKDRKEGSTFCEHRTPRLACSRMSSDSRPVLEPAELRSIFLNVETLVKVNTELLGVVQSGLRKLLDSRGEPSITEIVRVYTPAFVRVMPFFKMYSLYCHQYPNAIDKLLIARTRNKELNQLLKQREDRSETTLQSLLIKPVQRICKYPLLFQSLLKSIIPYVSEQVAKGADMDQLEHLVIELEKALETVDKIAKSVNEKVGEQESLETMMEVYAELGGEQAVPDLVSPSRRFVDRFEILVRRPPFEKNPEPLPESLYVFNDHLVFAVSRGTNNFSNSLRRGGGSLKKTSSYHNSSLKKIISFGHRVSSRRFSDSSTGSGNSARNSSGSGSGRSSGRTGGRKSGASSLRKSGGVLQPSVYVTTRLDLRSCQVRTIAKADDANCYGFTLTFVGRVVQDTNGEGAPVTTTVTSTHRRNGSLTEKVVTTIDKFEIWLGTEQARDDLLRQLEDQLGTLARQDAETKQATTTVGPVSRRKTRDWKNKTKGKEIERKYSNIRKSQGASRGNQVMTSQTA